MFFGRHSVILPPSLKTGRRFWKRGVKMMLNIVYKMIVKVLSGASPEIRNQIKAFLAELEEKAKQTSNPVDDILVLCLRIVLGF
jgi:hypothetical protein